MEEHSMEVAPAPRAVRRRGPGGRRRRRAGILQPNGTPRLHGRTGEQAQIDRLLGAATRCQSGALALRGDVGSGKSALLAYAAAQANGMLVLRCQGAQAESGLTFGALHQVLLPVLHLLHDLPPRLAAPLASAMGLAPEPPGTDRFLVCAGALALLARAAQERRLLCLVDDAQWVDAASAEAFAFVARRLHAEGIVLLVAVRDGEGRQFDTTGVPEVWLDGLAPRASADLLAELTGQTLVPEVSDLLVEQTGGLPLALVDAASILTRAQMAGRAALPEPLPLSAGLRRRLHQRVGLLPGPTQRLLVLVAAAGVERLHVVVSACAALGIDVAALENAEAAGLVVISAGLIECRSQLVQSAVYHEAAFFDRRAAHLAVAAALGQEDDGDRRAWHLAAAAVERDEAVAAELERAAERAMLRGQLARAAGDLERAAELTPDSQERGRRLAAGARLCLRAGRSAQAGELLSRAARLQPGPHLGADIAELNGVIALQDHDLEGAMGALVAGAGSAAASHPERAVELLLQAAEVAIAGGDAVAAAGLARQVGALEPADGGGAAALLRGVERTAAGHIEDAGPAAELAIAVAGASERKGHLLGLATALAAGGDLAPAAVTAALNLLTAEVARLRASSAAGELPGALANLAWLEFWADQHRSSLANASEGLARARALRQRWAEGGCAMAMAMLAAVRGQEDDCAALADLLLHPPGVQSAAMHAGAATWALALLDLGAGRFAEGLTRLGDLASGSRPVHPWYVVWSRPDAVEAAVRTGRMDVAQEALAALEQAASRGCHAPAGALLARSRALLASGAEAERHYLTALALHAEEERPFQQARTRLLWAEHLRRNRRRVDAREQLRLALEAFETLDARPWAVRARAELRATGETLRRGTPATDELTPQEIRIAHLVAEGGTNREVGEQLFLSPRTVGYHLARIYRKLGVSSRTKLANVLFEDELEGVDEGGRRARSGLAGRAKAAFRKTDGVARQGLMAPPVPARRPA